MGNLLDKAIEMVSPKWAMERSRARVAVDQIRKYEGGSKHKRTQKWFTPDRSVNHDIQEALPTLRARVRDLYQNEPYVTKGINSIVNKVVGRGIIPAISIPKKDTKEKRVKNEWKYWAKNCDWNDQVGFYGLQKMVIRTVAMTGEAVVLKRVNGNDKRNPLRLQVFSGEHIDMNKSTSLENNGHILNGIEFDSTGRKVAIWLFPILPSERYIFKSIVSKRYKMDDVIHVYHRLFPAQLRGVPFGTSSVIKSRDFNEFEDAELMRQKISACFVAFVHDIGDNGNSTDEDPAFEKVAPGIIEKLPPGKTVSFGTPPVNNSYHLYAKQVLHGMASGFGVSYESMTGDYSEVNFSSARMASIEMMEQMAEYQDDIMVAGFCDRVFVWFQQILTSHVPGGFDDMDVVWTPPKKVFVDPAKEVKAMGEQIRYGLASWSDSVRSLGKNPEELMNEIAAEREALNKLEVITLSDPAHDPNQKDDEPDDDDPKDDGTKKKTVKKEGK